MKPTRWTRTAAAAVALGVALSLGACSDDSDDEQSDAPSGEVTESSTDTTTSSEPTPSDPPPTEAETAPPATSGDVLTLDQAATAGDTGPSWAFPVRVDGWSVGTFDQGGLNQLTKDGSDALFSSYQLRYTRTGNDAEDGRAYLEHYLTEFQSTDGVESLGEPEWSTATLPSTLGEVEFVQQDYDYTTTRGSYRSRYLARPFGDYMLAVQYAAKTDEWSEEEWERLVAAGLNVVV